MTFDEWLNEQEGFGIRKERAFEDCKNGDFVRVLAWMMAAYQVGYEAGKSDEKESNWDPAGVE